MDHCIIFRYSLGIVARQSPVETGGMLMGYLLVRMGPCRGSSNAALWSGVISSASILGGGQWERAPSFGSLATLHAFCCYPDVSWRMLGLLLAWMGSGLTSLASLGSPGRQQIAAKACVVEHSGAAGSSTKQGNLGCNVLASR